MDLRSQTRSRRRHVLSGPGRRSRAHDRRLHGERPRARGRERANALPSPFPTPATCSRAPSPRARPARGAARRRHSPGDLGRPAPPRDARGLVWPGAKALATPTGDVAVDGVALALVPEVRVDAHAHAAEHSLEVELPFIKRLLPRATVVPIGASVATAAEVGRTLLALYGGPETLIVISTDLSHYLPYGEAKRVDQETIQRVLTLDVDAVDHDRACGATGLTGLMWLAREKGLVPRVYDLRSSGDTAGDHRRVVGYAALGFYERATRSHEVPS
ncbi:MAG: AmmeMemoRadiSam system protein B [Polyangiaceae bacterium]